MLRNTIQAIPQHQLNAAEVNKVSSHGIREGDGLAGRVAVVTGASSGIGRAASLALARQGAQICAVGRNPTALAETVAAVRPFSSITAFQIDLNVRRKP